MKRLILIAIILAFFSAATAAQVKWKLYKSVGPKGRQGHAIVYDHHRKKVILHGGDDDYRDYLEDTWEWDVVNKKWKQIFTEDAPQGRDSFVMVYDPGRRKVVLQGGSHAYSVKSPSTWEFNGVNWKYITGDGPGRVNGNAIVYDSSNQRILNLGGWGENNIVSNSVWKYKNNSWEFVTKMPFQRRDFALAYDEKNKRIVIHGGYDQHWDRKGETLIWKGKAWHLIDADQTGAGSLAYHSMVYHRGLKKLLLISGSSIRIFEKNRWRVVQLASGSENAIIDSSSIAYDNHNSGLWALGGSAYDEFASIYFASISKDVDFNFQSVRYKSKKKLHPGDDFKVVVVLKNEGKKATSNYRINIIASLFDHPNHYQSKQISSKYVRRKIAPGKKIKLTFTVTLDEEIPADDYFLHATVVPKENDFYLDNNSTTCKQKLKIFDSFK